jgi:6-pyruvoyltetrahydropterin/6-carboxytetrahydropterin synthase
MLVTCTRRLEWDAMHRIPNHEGKCKAFHGHRYVAEITCTATELDNLGRIIDFGILKSLIGTWIDENWDHTGILMANDTDPAIKAIIESNGKYGRPIYLIDAPPTAENIAIELAKVTQKLLINTEIELIALRVWETPNCSATWHI